MGLFSSSYITTVGTTVSRVMQDSLIVPSSKTGLIAGIFSKDPGQTVEHVLESITQGMGIRAERMFSQASRGYPYGMPSSKVSTSTDGAGIVLGLLQSVIPGATLDYYHFGPLNNLHAGWVNIIQNHGYDTSTNELVGLSAQKGFPVFLKDMVVVIKEATLAERENGSLEQWGNAATIGPTPERAAATGLLHVILPTPFRVDPDAAVEDAVEISYTWVVPTITIVRPEVITVVDGVTTVTPAVTRTDNVIHNESLMIPLTGYDREKEYFHIKYANGSQYGYVLYQMGAGTYPTVDSMFDAAPTSAGEFFPFIYFRHGSENMDADKNSEGYKVSKKLLKTLGINYQDIIDSIAENPDIAKIDQALMMLAVPAKSEDQMELRYLFDFFHKFYLASGGVGVGQGWDVGDVGSGTTFVGDNDIPISAAALFANKLKGNLESARLRINIEDKRLSTALSCAGVFKKIKAGTIGAIDTYGMAYATETFTFRYSVREVVSTTVNHLGDVTTVYADVPHTHEAPMDVFIYKKQITPYVYEEISVYDLQMTYYMWGGYSTVADDLAPFLLVPLDHAITKAYGVLDRELLYSRGLHFIFNAREVTEVKWYQQGWFSALVQVVGIVLTIWSMGSDGGYFSALAAALVEGGILAVVLTIAMDLIISVAVTQGLKLFVNAVGIDAAFLVALVAMAYGGFRAYQAGSIKGAPWASELLSMGNGLTTTINKSISDSLAGLSKEADEFNLLMKESWKTLDEIKKSMTQQDILTPNLILGQTPDEFYNMTYAGNIGVIGGIDSITSYVDIALTLPKLNDTIGSNDYGNYT